MDIRDIPILISLFVLSARKVYRKSRVSYVLWQPVGADPVLTTTCNPSHALCKGRGRIFVTWFNLLCLNSGYFNSAALTARGAHVWQLGGNTTPAETLRSRCFWI